MAVGDAGPYNQIPSVACGDSSPCLKGSHKK